MPCEFKYWHKSNRRLYSDPQGREGLADILAEMAETAGPSSMDDAWLYGFVDDSEQDPCTFDAVS